MNLKFRIQYLTRKTLLTFLGPAHHDVSIDPLDELERERERVLGPRQHAGHTHPARKRRFTDYAQRTGVSA